MPCLFNGGWVRSGMCYERRYNVLNFYFCYFSLAVISSKANGTSYGIVSTSLMGCY